MTLHKQVAIKIENLNKVYTLYHNKVDQLRDLLGLKRKQAIQEHYALKNINLDIGQGQRIALVGRNGAGKSTLLKMLTGNFKPTSGKITINGKVQALMSTGIGFHYELTGYENIKASLAYNDLSTKEINAAIDEIIHFVELGDYLHQPVKTYSLGMQSRLSFATATAIKPEILIIDEVLGAGDAYFTAKSVDRMKKLTNNGCTLLLVSHATSQVLQFCEDAIWLESGEIVKQGRALEVVKAYEAYSKKLEFEHFNNPMATTNSSVIQSTWLREKLLHEALSAHSKNEDISRWPSMDSRLKINNVCIVDENNNALPAITTGAPVRINIDIIANAADNYDCYFVVLLFTEDGRWISRHCSDKYQFSLQEGQVVTTSLFYDNLCLGNGKFIFSAAIYKVLDLDDLDNACYYDLLSRSFEFTVIAPYKDDFSLLHLPARWKILSPTLCKEST
jgi:lipopolysaccharide transport system ATP-binding protein